MKRMWDEQEFVELIEKYAPQVKPEDIQEMFNEGEVSLDGKYVRIMDAPESTTLSNEQIAQIKEGVFINDTFLNQINPVLFPARLIGGGALYRGVYISYGAGGNPSIGLYEINTGTKVISILTETTRFLDLKSISKLNGKEIPAYPSNTGTFTLKMVNGTLTWVEDI